MKTSKVSAFFRTPYNFQPKQLLTDVEVPVGTSLTIPNQTVSIREQLARFSGGTLQGLAGSFMEQDDDAPDFSKMDTIEILRWREEAIARQEEIVERFRVASAALALKDDEARFEAEVERRLAAKPIIEQQQPAD